MNRLIVASLCASTLAGGALLSAQQLPSAPAKAFGTSITGSYEGWYDNPDGTHVFLVGYYNRNISTAMDIPIGPNNRIEPGGPDMGQPTHFLPGRQTGAFTVTVPKAFSPQQRLTWTIVANGTTISIPFKLNADYNVSPFADAIGNKPPVAHLFDEKAPPFQGPVSSMATGISRTASMAAGLVLPVWVSDDAFYTSGTNAPMRNPPPPVTIMWAQFRGPAAVTFDDARPKLDVLAGGQVGVPFSGKAATTAKFSQPGEYVLQLTANDYTGAGGRGEVCCWTNALVKVNVTP
jgi:hypothetical protein